MTGWSEAARATIAAVHAQLPANTTFAERRTALRRAYPFVDRYGWPYKAWLKAQREYLRRYDDRPLMVGLFAEPRR